MNCLGVYIQIIRNCISNTHTLLNMYSYAPDAIGEYELGDRKVAYEGTLDQIIQQ